MLSEKNWVQKNYGYKENVWSKTYFSSKNFGPKRFLRLNKSLGTKIGWVQKKFWVQKDILGQKNVCPKKFRALNKLWVQINFGS